MPTTTKRIGPFSLASGAAYQTLQDALVIDVSNGPFLSIQAVIEGASSGAPPVDTPVGSWRLHALGDEQAPPIRLTSFENGPQSLLSIAPNGNNVVNGYAVFPMFPTIRGKLQYVYGSGGATARATLWITTAPAAPTDKSLISAASLRGPLRGEVMVIQLPATPAARTYNVPDGLTAGQPNWKGKIVNMFADGGDVYLQISTGTDANVDEIAVAQEVLASGRYTLTPSASGNGCWRIPNGQWVPVPFSLLDQSFSLKAPNGACKLRTHVAET